VLIDQVVEDRSGNDVELSARVSWKGGERRVSVRWAWEVPIVPSDASPFLPMALLPAMLRGEDLHVDGLVSPRLLHNAGIAATAYASWHPGLRRPRLSAGGPAARRVPHGRTAAFFSRGVDSMFTAALDRGPDPAVTQLVFCDGLEPRHSQPTAHAEIVRAQEAANALGLPLLLVTTDVRWLSDGLCDWADAHGGALAGVGLCLGGGIGRMVIPSSDSFASLVPFGSSPLLDGWFSTESVEIVHDVAGPTRAGKVASLARDRRDLLPFLKVCYAEDRVDNCGRCGKCVLTMACLAAVDALGEAAAFPDDLDLDLVRRMGVSPLQSRMNWEATMRTLPATGANGELRSAMAEAMRRSARPRPRRRLRQVTGWARGSVRRPHGSWRDPDLGFDWRFHARTLSLLHYGLPEPDLDDAGVPPLGLRLVPHPGGARRPALDLAGWIDRPVDGEVVVNNVAELRGWVPVDRGYDRVVVEVDGRPPELARICGASRPDVAESLGQPAAVMAGWEHVVDMSWAQPGTAVALSVRAEGPAGAVLLGRRRIVHRGWEAPEPDARHRVARAAAAADSLAAEHRPAADALRVVVATHNLEVGGAQLHLQRVLFRLLEEGGASCLVVAADDGPLASELEERGARVHIGAVPSAEGLGYERRLRELVALVATERANVVLANTLAAFWAVDLAARCGIPSLWNIHEHYTFDRYARVGLGLVDGHVRDRFRASLDRADAITVVADATGRQYLDAGDVRVQRVDYGVDRGFDQRGASTTERDAARAALGIDGAATVLVCVATVEPRKAQAALLTAFARVAPRHPDVLLVLVGDQPGDYSSGVRALRDALHLEASVRIEAVTRDTDSWYRAADVAVLVSDVESLPRTLLEAVAFDLPIVATAVAGVPEVFTDGDSAVLCGPRDLGEIERGLSRILAMSAAERATMAARARERVDLEGRARYPGVYVEMLRRLVRRR
jgi:glycosyltransferase involved in cell wall biosynthesis